METQLPLPKRGHSSPHFSAHVYCSQTARWIKIPLGKDSPWPRPHCVRWGPSSPLKGGIAPIFGPRLLWPNGWMDQDAIWYAGWRRSRRYCVIGGRPSFPLKGAQPPPLFGLCLLWPNGRPSQLLLSTCLYFASPFVFSHNIVNGDIGFKCSSYRLSATSQILYGWQTNPERVVVRVLSIMTVMKRRKL